MESLICPTCKKVMNCYHALRHEHDVPMTDEQVELGRKRPLLTEVSSK